MLIWENHGGPAFHDRAGDDIVPRPTGDNCCVTCGADYLLDEECSDVHTPGGVVTVCDNCFSWKGKNSAPLLRCACRQCDVPVTFVAPGVWATTLEVMECDGVLVLASCAGEEEEAA